MSPSEETEVRRICRALDGVIERPSWNRPVWFARTLVARMWEDAVLMVISDEREAALVDH